MRLSLFCALALTACQYIPVAHYACSTEHPNCPPYQPCQNGCCGEGPCGNLFYDTGGGAQDMRSASGEMDAQGMQDLAPANDLLLVAPGCASGTGFQYSTTAALCPGVFASDPSSLCAAGWAACATNPMTAAECATMKPFGVQGCYLGAVRAADTSFPATASQRCTWTNAGASDYRYILACGSCVGWSTAGVQCGGFTNVVTCDDPRTIFAYHCPKSVPGKDSDFLQVTNSDPASGVMCCKQ